MYVCDRYYTTTLTAETDIPHFKEVIIMATSCDHCGYKTNEVRSGAGISETGVRINLRITSASDLNRDILKVLCTSQISIRMISHAVRIQHVIML